ncbi:hypothetical protein [Methanococcoides sp. FTZ1]|uniref:hypothetical protein n=1 Tax=Methanococcoides sp. FTZ1 TaxID=3439061 RepID=UPI003F83AB14
MIDYSLVEILKTIPEFKGIDGNNYSLSDGENKYIPSMNADSLQGRNVVKIVETVFLRIVDHEEFQEFYNELVEQKKETLVWRRDLDTIQVSTEDPICNLWIESTIGKNVCKLLDLVEEGLEGINIFNESVEIDVREILTEYIEYNQKRNSSAVSFKSCYKISIANIAQGSLSLPIAIISTGVDPVRIGMQEMYIQPISKETKKLLTNKPIFESKQFRESVFRKELLKKYGISDKEEGEYSTTKGLNELWDEFLGLCYEETLPVPKEEIQNCKNLTNVLEMAVTGGLEIDHTLYLLLSAQIPLINPNILDPEEYMPYAPHQLLITNSKTGKTTTASRISENVVRDATVSNLLGFSTSDTKHIGLMHGQVNTTFIDELTESMETEVSNGLSNYMETGITYRARGTGIKVRGHSPIVFLANPVAFGKSETYIEIYEIFHETLTRATGNPTALGSRLGTVLFNPNLKTASGERVENYVSKNAHKVLKTVSWCLRNDFSDLFKDKKVLSWLNKPFPEQYISEIEKIVKDIPINAIKEFFKGNKDSYRHVRGTALHIVFYQNFERYMGNNKPKITELLEECEEQYQLLCELNLDSFRKIASIKVDRSFFERKVERAPEYIKVLLETVSRYGEKLERIPYDDLETPFNTLTKKEGKYSTFGRLNQSVFKSLQKTNSYLNGFGFEILKTEDVRILKIIDSDTATFVLDFMDNKNIGYSGYNGYNSETDNVFSVPTSYSSYPRTQCNILSTGKTVSEEGLYPSDPSYHNFSMGTDMQECAERWKQSNKTEVNNSNIDRFIVDFLIDQGQSGKKYDPQEVRTFADKMFKIK